MYQDLHSHTYYSFCGKDAPEAVVEAAIAGGLELFGITDHNYGIGYSRLDVFQHPAAPDFRGSCERTLRRYFDHINLIREKYADRIVLPEDLAWLENGERREAAVGSIPTDIGSLDIGSKTAENYRRLIESSATVFVNGPMGVFEQETTELGTKTVWLALGAAKAYTVVGGGDSITATTKYGQTEQIDYICTGGGALIRFLTGEELPVVKALRHGATVEEKK